MHEAVILILYSTKEFVSQKKKKNVSRDTFACPEKKDVDTR